MEGEGGNNPASSANTQDPALNLDDNVTVETREEANENPSTQ